MDYYSYFSLATDPGANLEYEHDQDDVMVDYMWRDLQRQLTTLSVDSEPPIEVNRERDVIVDTNL